jgi:hypothetical protein
MEREYIPASCDCAKLATWTWLAPESAPAIDVVPTFSCSEVGFATVDDADLLATAAFEENDSLRRVGPEGIMSSVVIFTIGGSNGAPKKRERGDA